MIFIVFLKFSTHRADARLWMDAHNAWVRRGVEDGVFLVVGSLAQGAGGGIVAIEASREALQARLDEDPFVANRVVDAEVVPLTPSRASPLFEGLLSPLGRSDASA